MCLSREFPSPPDTRVHVEVMVEYIVFLWVTRCSNETIVRKRITLSEVRSVCKKTFTNLDLFVIGLLMKPDPIGELNEQARHSS